MAENSTKAKNSATDALLWLKRFVLLKGFNFKTICATHQGDMKYLIIVSSVFSCANSFLIVSKY